MQKRRGQKMACVTLYSESGVHNLGAHTAQVCACAVVSEH